MKATTLIATTLGAAALALTSVPALAQNTADTTATTTTYPAPPQDDDDDDSGKWGLAGLIGLAGLLGLKRRDRDHDHRTNTGTSRTSRAAICSPTRTAATTCSSSIRFPSAERRRVTTDRQRHTSKRAGSPASRSCSKRSWKRHSTGGRNCSSPRMERAISRLTRL